jgi:uncharacterized protein (DUF58 family)
MENWLDKRIPAAAQFSLGHRNIFIFPSRFGGLFVFLCAGLFLLGTNYQNNLMIMLCYFLLSLMLLNLFIAYLNFAKLTIQIGKVQNAFVGSKIQLPIWVIHSNSLPHGLLHLNFWQQQQSITTDLDQFSNPIYLALSCEKRGPVKLPRVTINSYFPLGLFRCWTHLQFSSHILAYPKPLPCSIELHHQQDNDQQQIANLSLRGHDDFDSLAPYKQGEPLYHVAWKQVAKGHGLISKQFSHQSGASGWLLLAAMPAADINQKLQQLSYQIIELTRNNQLFGLDLGDQKIAVDMGLEHQQRCLSALALYRIPIEDMN